MTLKKDVDLNINNRMFKIIVADRKKKRSQPNEAFLKRQENIKAERLKASERAKTRRLVSNASFMSTFEVNNREQKKLDDLNSSVQ